MMVFNEFNCMNFAGSLHPEQVYPIRDLININKIISPEISKISSGDLPKANSAATEPHT